MSTKRKFRKYKGWWYDPDLHGFREQTRQYHINSAAVVCCYYLHDDDHAALMDLKANPYEPQPTLEDVVNKWWWSKYPLCVPDCHDLCAAIRETFPHIDTPPETDA